MYSQRLARVTATNALFLNLTLFFSGKSTDFPHHLDGFFQKNDIVPGPMVGVSFGLMNRINTET